MFPFQDLMLREGDLLWGHKFWRMPWCAKPRRQEPVAELETAW